MQQKWQENVETNQELENTYREIYENKKDMKEARKQKCPAECKGPFGNTDCEYTCHNKN